MNGRGTGDTATATATSTASSTTNTTTNNNSSTDTSDNSNPNLHPHRVRTASFGLGGWRRRGTRILQHSENPSTSHHRSRNRTNRRSSAAANNNRHNSLGSMMPRLLRRLAQRTSNGNANARRREGGPMSRTANHNGDTSNDAISSSSSSSTRFSNGLSNGFNNGNNDIYTDSNNDLEVARRLQLQEMEPFGFGDTTTGNLFESNDDDRQGNFRPGQRGRERERERERGEGAEEVDERMRISRLSGGDLSVLRWLHQYPGLTLDFLLSVYSQELVITAVTIAVLCLYMAWLPMNHFLDGAMSLLSPSFPSLAITPEVPCFGSNAKSDVYTDSGKATFNMVQFLLSARGLELWIIPCMICGMVQFGLQVMMFTRLMHLRRTTSRFVVADEFSRVVGSKVWFYSKRSAYALYGITCLTEIHNFSLWLMPSFPSYWAMATTPNSTTTPDATTSSENNTMLLHALGSDRALNWMIMGLGLLGSGRLVSFFFSIRRLHLAMYRASMLRSREAERRRAYRERRNVSIQDGLGRGGGGGGGIGIPNMFPLFLSGPRPLSHSLLAKLDSRKVTTQDEHACSICLAEYQKGDIVSLLPCPGRHEFHEACVKKWLHSASTCPLCVVDIRDRLMRM